MDNQKESSGFLRSFYLRISSVLLLTLYVFAGACSDSTDPVVKPEDLSFQYLPDATVITLRPGEYEDFSVTSNPDVTLGTQWKLNRQVVGEGKVFRYDAIHIGIDTLRLDTSYSAVNWDRSWYIDIVENEETIPPTVPDIVISHGPEAADVKVNWRIIPHSTYSIVEYQVAMSSEGAITTANWSDAVLLGSYPHLENQIGYSATFTRAEDGMPPGETVWFAVRGVDEAGQFSSIDGVYSHLVSFEWYIEGYVHGDDGEPLTGIIISYGCESCRVATTSEGFFSIGPVPNVNTYELVTDTYDSPGNGEPYNSYYDLVASGVHYEPDGNYDMMLLTRYGLDDSCENYGLEFMTYFKYMTKTVYNTALRPNLNLYKWENYPVPVYVPVFTSEDGVDYGSLCREVVGYWNLAMGEDYLVLVDAPEPIGIEFDFGDEGNGSYYGSTTLSKPDDQNYDPGDVVPEKMRIYMWDRITQERELQEIAMHELGHALGLHEHTICSGDGFLMAPSPFGILANGAENAVHGDEKRAVRAIRNLPQGSDISTYELE